MPDSYNIGEREGVAGVRQYQTRHRTGLTLYTASLLHAAALLLTFAVGCPAHATAPPPEPIRERVDLIEVNNFYDPEGRLVFDQVIFWGYYSDTGTFHVLAWRLIKQPWQKPTYDHASREWVTAWSDDGRMRVVRAMSAAETWSQHDPEAEDRSLIPSCERRGLLEGKRK